MNLKKRFLTRTWKGFLILLPLIIFIIVAYGIFTGLGNIGKNILGIFMENPNSALGLLAILAIILFVSFFLGKFNPWEFTLQTIMPRIMPGLKNIPKQELNSAKKKMIALSWNDLSNMTPCLFWQSATIQHIGFIMSEQRIKGGEKTLLQVYRPDTPAIIMGEVYPINKKYVFRLENDVTEILLNLIYNIYRPEELKPIPWEDETEERFQKRINSTPIQMEIEEALSHYDSIK